MTVCVCGLSWSKYECVYGPGMALNPGYHSLGCTKALAHALGLWALAGLFQALLG